jgi:hypothetical protein
MTAKSAAPAAIATAGNVAAAAGRQVPAARNGAEVATAAILTGAL